MEREGKIFLNELDQTNFCKKIITDAEGLTPTVSIQLDFDELFGASISLPVHTACGPLTKAHPTFVTNVNKSSYHIYVASLRHLAPTLLFEHLRR